MAFSIFKSTIFLCPIVENDQAWAVFFVVFQATEHHHFLGTDDNISAIELFGFDILFSLRNHAKFVCVPSFENPFWLGF
jgi:hypothetical protein